MSRHQARPNVTTIRFVGSGTTGDARTQFELDLERLELHHQGRPVALRPLAIRALAVLVRNEGRLVSSAELRRELWGERHLEWRNSLHRCVRDLRVALSDDPRDARFVATVARRGYRFVGERIPPAGPNGLRSWLRRPSLGFAAGFATAVLVPLSVVVVCVVLAS